MKKVLITGATGNVGRNVIRFLRDSSSKIIGADYQEEAFRNLFGDEIDFRKLNFYKKETYETSLAGIDKVFLMRPPQISKIKKHIEPFVEKMAEKNIEHVVSLSIVGANILTPHFRMEKKVEKYNLPYTHIRAGFFMQNLSTTHRELIRDKNELCVPAGNGKITFTDVRDIAEVIATVLKSGEYKHQILRITGNQPLDHYQIAERMSEILNKDIFYTSPSSREFKREMRKYGYPNNFLRIASLLYFTVRMGKGNTIYDDLENILGREPRSIDQFITDYKHKWIKK